MMSTGKIIALVLGLCGGGVLLLMLACGGLFYAGYSNASANASPKIDALFEAIAKNDLKSTYENETGAEFKKLINEEQFAGIAETISSRLGKLKRKSLRGYMMKQRSTGNYIETTYAADFEKGSGTILATLKHEDGDWKIVGFRVNSPLFDQDIALHRCPACKAPYPASAKFCPACGAVIATASGSSVTSPP